MNQVVLSKCSDPDMFLLAVRELSVFPIETKSVLNEMFRIREFTDLKSGSLTVV